MPEGDTIMWAANRIRPALEGRTIDTVRTHARFARDRWEERLEGKALRAVDTHGKHLFLRFEGDLTLHSHLRMTGWWGVYGRGERWRKAAHRAWLVLGADDQEAVQFDGPVLELLTESRTRFDRRLAGLGPDVLAPELDERRFLERLRADDARRGIGDAILDQRTLAGIGNMWKAEGCWQAAVDPWRAIGEISDQEALAIVHAVRPPMLESGTTGRPERLLNVYSRAGRPCPRCGAKIRARGQGDDNRTTYWCPGCQR
jgi:endonuclease VIII